MRCSRQLLPCRDENRRPPAANRRPGGCRSRRYSPSDVDFDALAARPLGAHRRAARCETFSDTQERCTVRSSERASGARGVASSYGECIASTRAHRIAYSGCACSDQHWSSLFSLAASTLAKYTWEVSKSVTKRLFSASRTCEGTWRAQDASGSKERQRGNTQHPLLCVAKHSDRPCARIVGPPCTLSCRTRR